MKNITPIELRDIQYIYVGHQDKRSLQTVQSVFPIFKGHRFFMPMHLDTTKFKEFIKYNEEDSACIDALENKIEDKQIYLFMMPDSLKQAIFASSVVRLWAALHPDDATVYCGKPEVWQNILIEGAHYKASTINIKHARMFGLSGVTINAVHERTSPSIIQYLQRVELPPTKGYMAPKIAYKKQKEEQYDICIEIFAKEDGYNAFNDTQVKDILDYLKDKYNIIVTGNIYPHDPDIKYNEDILDTVSKSKMVLSLGDFTSGYVAGALGKPCIMAIPNNRCATNNGVIKGVLEKSILYMPSIKAIINPSQKDIISEIDIVLEKTKEPYYILKEKEKDPVKVEVLESSSTKKIKKNKFLSIKSDKKNKKEEEDIVSSDLDLIEGQDGYDS